MNHVLLQGPGRGWRTAEQDVLTEVRVTLLTELTVATRDRRFHSYASTHRWTIDAWPESRDPRRELVPDHKWLLHLVISDTTVQKIVDS
jgi:hypothetical protein